MQYINYVHSRREIRFLRALAVPGSECSRVRSLITSTEVGLDMMPEADLMRVCLFRAADKDSFVRYAMLY